MHSRAIQPAMQRGFVDLSLVAKTQLADCEGHLPIAEARTPAAASPGPSTIGCSPVSRSTREVIGFIMFRTSDGLMASNPPVPAAYAPKAITVCTHSFCQSSFVGRDFGYSLCMSEFILGAVLSCEEVVRGAERVLCELMRDLSEVWRRESSEVAFPATRRFLESRRIRPKELHRGSAETGKRIALKI